VREGILYELIKGKLQERCFFLFNDVLVRAKRAKSDRRHSVHDPTLPPTLSNMSTSSTSTSTSATAFASLSSPSERTLRQEKWEFLEKVPLRDVSVINRDDDGGISLFSSLLFSPLLSSPLFTSLLSLSPSFFL
jgi:hypothetical protein